MKIQIRIVLLLAAGFATLSYGESETLLSEYDDKIDARFDVGGGGTFKSFDGTEVGYWALPGEGRPIVFITGLGETFLHYKETTWDLRALDRPIYIVELRSQGHGERLSSASPQIYYLESFEDYKKDFDTFMRQIVEEDGPVDIVAHSTGAYPAAEYALENSDEVRQLILVAPLVKPNLGSVPDWAAKLMAHTMCLVGMCDHYVPSRKDYVPNTAKFAGTMLTRRTRVRVQETGRAPPT